MEGMNRASPLEESISNLKISNLNDKQKHFGELGFFDEIMEKTPRTGSP
jgi:hypothetical protein